ALKVPQVRLAAHGAPEPIQVALDYRTPLLKARTRQMRRQPAVQPPGAPFGAGEIGAHWPPGDLKLISHAGQQPVELVIAQLDLPGEELADARLPHPAQTPQFRLAGARAEHDVAQYMTLIRHP